jgi:hypothetical protein
MAEQTEWLGLRWETPIRVTGIEPRRHLPQACIVYRVIPLSNKSGDPIPTAFNGHDTFYIGQGKEVFGRSGKLIRDLQKGAGASRYEYSAAKHYWCDPSLETYRVEFPPERMALTWHFVGCSPRQPDETLKAFRNRNHPGTRQQPGLCQKAIETETWLLKKYREDHGGILPPLNRKR